MRDRAKKHLTSTMLLNDALNQSLTTKSIDAPTRTIIPYALEINDPWLPNSCAASMQGESIIDNLFVASSEEKIDTLTDLICRAGDEPSAALLVLLSTSKSPGIRKPSQTQLSTLPFTRCGELNLYGMVDAQIAVLLLADDILLF